MKKEILQNLANEVKTCRRYALNAVKKAEEGKISSAISMLDIAQTAKTCAMKAHDELWKVSGGKLNDTEFELFADAETSKSLSSDSTSKKLKERGIVSHRVGRLEKNRGIIRDFFSFMACYYALLE